ncbi:MAG: purine-nucleoside phosphorylase [Thermoanaerobaculia bacterium]
MQHWQDELTQAVKRWRALGRPAPDVAVVAGSGLSVDLARPLAGPEPLADWLPFPVLPVAGHRHEIELLELPSGKCVLYFRGRIHGYQGYSPAEVVFPVRFAALLGARVLLMTNAAGGVRADWPAGTLATVSDQLNLTGSNPLFGDPPAAWGARFPDMLAAFDPSLRALAREHATALGMELPEGVYAGLNGPSYETPAEVRMLRTLGADLVGMSTVHEVIAARHLGMRCLVISLVANPGAGVTTATLHHEEVLEAGREAAGRVRALFAALLGDPRVY